MMKTKRSELAPTQDGPATFFARVWRSIKALLSPPRVRYVRLG
jgi:hypothetical protein